MIPKPQTDGATHSSTNPGSSNHHPIPSWEEIDSAGVVSISAGSDYNLDIALDSSDYKLAKIHAFGKRQNFGFTNRGREGAIVWATRTTGEAISTSFRDANSGFKHYAGGFDKSQGDSDLSFKVFDDYTGTSQLYITLRDAYINGSDLRLTFHNHDGSARDLWVRGIAFLL